MGAGPLREALAALSPITDPKLLVGANTADDAGVYQINDTEALVVTTDFFPPIVDDPYQFGQIAAANALSDVYAMGGRPLVALNILCFPLGRLKLSHLTEILRGGQDKVAEAGAVIAGGHSVKDNELKYGLAVTGLVKLDQLKTNAAARPGDKLILTKPLGTGIISTAMKNNVASDNAVAAAIASMALLNRAAADAALEFDCSSITDITGFGLVGHALEMAEASGVAMHLDSSTLPQLPQALELAAKGQLTGGGRDNRNFCEDRTRYENTLAEPLVDLLHDPQTSGGLLLAIAARDAETLLQHIRDDCPQATLVGEVTAGAPAIVVS
ncbi:MAG: selenide, water dikinase SelD [bacterium]